MRARSAISGLFLVVCLAATAGLSAGAPQPANLDKLVLAWLPLFWPHEPDPGHRAEMLRWARDGGLAASAAWIQARL